jgi:hypothetical protein
MPSEDRLEIYRQHREQQTKYVYFLLAASGASIAFAVTQTRELALNVSQLPLGIAVVLWALSFVFGCLHIQQAGEVLHYNGELLRIQAGQHPMAGQDPTQIFLGGEVVRKLIDKHSTTAARWGRAQFRFVVLGALFYIAWHAYEMWLRAGLPAIKWGV